MHIQRRQIHAAFEVSLNLSRTVLNAPEPSLEVTDNAEFGVHCSVISDCFYIYITTGVVDALTKLWASVPQTILFNSTNGNLTQQTHVSIIWLIRHELEHAVLGHFGLHVGQLALNLIAQRIRVPITLNAPPKGMHDKVEPCLELQADHDAIELMLDSYSTVSWNDIRATIASIAAVMVLIEKVDEENQIEHSTHPKAATRIFQLLGHVTEMWSLPAHAKAKARGETAISENDLPSDEEKQAFSKEVILPAFWDAVALAEVAKAKSIISDLGSPEDFFADVARAKLGQWDELVTVGAIEWAELKDANDLILPLLPINQETN